MMDFQILISDLRQGLKLLGAAFRVCGSTR